MALAQYDFYCDAGADWQKVVRLRDPGTGQLIPMNNAVMEVRNSNYGLVMRLDGASGRCMIDPVDGASIHLHITAEESYSSFKYGNYPGTVQAVGIWGIGRAYIYDMFAVYSTGVQDRLLRGFFYVDPNISQPTFTIAGPPDTGVDEVWIGGGNEPPSSTVELWYDTDAGLMYDPTELMNEVKRLRAEVRELKRRITT